MPRNTTKLLISKLKIFKSYTEIHNFLNQLEDELTRAEDTMVLSFLNAHALRIGFDDVDFTNVLKNSTYLLRDGIGIRLLMKNAGLDPGWNMNGTDMIPVLLDVFNAHSLMIIGGQEGVAERVRQSLIDKHDGKIWALDGYRPTSNYLAEILQKTPKVILLGMGMPRQEKLFHQIQQLGLPTLVINGGGILEFMSGNIPRAPRLIIKLNLEWLWRIFCEPIRLCKRYLYDGAFLLRICVSQ